MKLTDQGLDHLQKLACIKLSSEEQDKLGNQLKGIISFLDKLKEIKIDKQSINAGGTVDNPLRTLGKVKKFDDPKLLLENVKHEKINNSIVIKSVLS